MQPRETAHDFILRVELKRSKYDINPKETFRAFKNVLPVNYWEKLDEAREFAVLIDEDAELEINWETLVRRARHATRSIRLGPGGNGGKVAGFENTKKHVPPVGTAIIVPP